MLTTGKVILDVAQATQLRRAGLQHQRLRDDARHLRDQRGEEGPADHRRSIPTS